MADAEANQLEAIRRFVGSEATSATVHSNSFQGGWIDDADALPGADADEIEGLEEDDDEDVVPMAPPLPPPPAPKPKLKLRLSASVAAPQPQPAPQDFAQQPQVMEVPDYSGGQGNFSSLLEGIGQPEFSGGGSGYEGGASGGGASSGAYGADYWGSGYFAADSGASGGGGWAGDGSGAASAKSGAGASGDSYKAMHNSAKTEWFERNHVELLGDPSDENFRRLFGCGRGRTPLWRQDFEKWCRQNGKSFSVGFGFSPPAASKVSSSTKWSELDHLGKENVFHILKTKLDSIKDTSGVSISLEQATDTLKEILRSDEVNVTSQGSALLKLREFQKKFNYHIEGLSPGASSSSSSSSSKAPKRSREVTDVLEEAIQLYRQKGGTISRSSLYALFPDL